MRRKQESSTLGVDFHTNTGIFLHMKRDLPRSGERPLHWVGSAKADFMAFPTEVRSDMGYALGVAQLGGMHPRAKPWKGEGAGVVEVVERFDGNAYRAVYTVRFHGAVYVLHAFQKKSPSGIRTATQDVELVGQRLKRARDDHARFPLEGRMSDER
ncbi:MAG: type II toxin-antitoxin system RelE/ParE family toxin [Beijerinckiaceae bacterium]